MPRRDERPDARPDEGLIHAWLDGELGAEEAARVERLVAEDPEWAAAVAEARGLVAASTRIVGALDVVAGDVIPRGASAAGTHAPTPRVARQAVRTWMRVAAGIVFVAGVGYLGLDRSGGRSVPAEMSETARETRSDVADAVSGEVVDRAAKQAVSVRPTQERRVRQTALEARNESTTATTSAAAPPPPTSAIAAGVAGVAGGVATGVASRPSAEVKEMLGAAAGSAEREERMKSMQRAITATPSARVERVLDSPSAAGAATMDRVVERATERTNLTGCWRTETTARVESVQNALRVLRSAGDTLVLALTPVGAEARVVRESETVLRGTARGVTGPPATFRADRTTCTR